MDLSLVDASRLLGKTPRQVRYMIKQGRLKARKDGVRWVISDADLPLSDAQRRAQAKKAQELREIVEGALGPHLRSGKRTYGVRDLQAFVQGRAVYKDAIANLGDGHPAAVSLLSTLVSTSQGCYRYHDRDKLDAYRTAREESARAIAMLLVDDHPKAEGLAESLEREVIPALTGLIRKAERKGRR
jgi:hypothetical protein